MHNFQPQQPTTALIIGGGGIASALVQKLVEQPEFSRVHQVSRQNISGNEKVIPHKIEAHSAQEIARIKQEVTRKAPEGIGLMVVAIGTLHSDQYRPEKSIRQIDADAMAKVYEINCILPSLWLAGCIDLLHTAEPAVAAALSARVGSISDNRLGGWYSYRNSKAALNMFLKSLSIEIVRKHPNRIIIGLHPGTVKTKLSAPFSVGKDAFSPSVSASYLWQVLNTCTPQHNGVLLDWQGKIVPY